MLGLVRALRATGADLPFGDLRGAHPGVALESHFWRFADLERRRVVLCAVTRCRDLDGEEWTSVVLGAAGPRGGGHVAQSDLTGVVADEDGLRLSADGLEAGPAFLRARAGGAWVDVEVEEPVAWSRRRHGGLGLAHAVPGLSQYWHPHLLGGRVRGAAQIAGRRIALDGALAYGEKNWGAGGAPPRWWWGQGFVDAETTFAFAGGVLTAGPARAGATAVAVRAGEQLVAFAPPLALVRVQTAPGRWAVDAQSARHRLRLRGRADGEPLHLPVPVPSERRTQRDSHQHQAGEVELELRRGRRLVVAGAAALSGLEVGGAAP